MSEETTTTTAAVALDPDAPPAFRVVVVLPIEPHPVLQRDLLAAVGDRLARVGVPLVSADYERTGLTLVVGQGLGEDGLRALLARGSFTVRPVIEAGFVDGGQCAYPDGTNTQGTRGTDYIVDPSADDVTVGQAVLGSRGSFECFRVGAQLSSAGVRLDGGALAGTTAGPVGDGWAVDAAVEPSAQAAFDGSAAECAAGAGSCVGRRLAFVVDGVVVFATPPLQSPAFGDRVRIEGGMSEGQARALAAVLAAGPLPTATSVGTVTPA